MNCAFCQRTGEAFTRVNALLLCPECLNQLLSVSPEDREYDWFVSAVRRAIFASEPEVEARRPAASKG